MSGTADGAATFAKSKCGTYGDDGKKGAYDVVFIPGAIRDSGITISRGGYGKRQCGTQGGFAIGDSDSAIAAAITLQTVCCKFLIIFKPMQAAVPKIGHFWHLNI